MASANVLRTIFTYAVSGLGPYTIAFDYLARKFVQVTLIGPDRKLLVLNTDYRFTSTKAVTLLKAAPAGYTQIEIRRYTDATDRLVDFQDGSILRATDLNVSQVQTMHIAEEGRDVASNTLGVDADGNLDARGRKVVNLVDGMLDGDAVTIRQMKSWSDSALNQANRAKTEADRAKTEADRATTQAGNASTSAQAAKTAENNSKTSENNSKTSETNSKASETAAGLSAGRASVSESNSLTSAAAASGSAAAALTQANRAEAEANKLGNMNDFASSIKSVNTSTFRVDMKGELGADGGFRYNKDAANTGASLGLGCISQVTASFRPTAAQTFTAPGLNSSMRFTDDNSVSQSDLFQQWSDGQFKTVLRTSVMANDGSLTGTQGRLELWRSGLLRNSGSFETTGVARTMGDAPNINIGSFLNSPAIVSQLNWQGSYRNSSQFYNQEYVGNYQSMFIDVRTATKTTTWSFREGGGIFTPQGQVQVVGSDIRLKTDVTEPASGWGKRIDQIGIVEYTWIDSGRRERGWIAQQVDMVDDLYAFQMGPVNPESDDADLLNVSQNSLIADLILEVQSLRVRVRALENK